MLLFLPCPTEVYEVPEEEVRPFYNMTPIALRQGANVIVRKDYRSFKGEDWEQISFCTSSFLTLPFQKS